MSQHIFYLMGKSASGKDTIYRELLSGEKLPIRKMILYTTRPIRAGEENGREYFFTDRERFEQLLSEGRVIEERTYQTVHGPWTYYTADDGQIDLTKHSYLGIGTLESYVKLKAYYGEEKMIPLYIEVEDGERLSRALSRERQQEAPKYAELCRRFLADAEDFSEEKLTEAGITRRYRNENLQDCLTEIENTIRTML